MQIVLRKIDELIPYVNNARKNDHAVDAVASSIKNYGFKQPIVIDSHGEVIAGHTRLKAAKKLGLKDVPVIVADDLTPAQVKAYRIADNRVGELAEWDMELLKVELEDIEGFTGFEVDELQDLFEDEAKEENFDAEEAFNEIKEPVTKRGWIYRLGNHRLMCGDSTNEEDVAKLMNGQKVDMVFTDPPYNVSFNGRSGNFDVIKNDNLEKTDFENFINKVINVIYKLNVENYYIWCNWNFYSVLQKKLPYKACIVWAKNVFGLGIGYRHQHEFCLFHGKIDENIKNESDLWEIKKDSNYVHPTQKPVELSERALKNHKNAKNIIDLFGGSGSTLIGCEKTNRNCFMMELDEKYCDVIVKRWEDYTGLKAERIE